MRIVTAVTWASALALGGLCPAQEWEIGALGGGGFANGLTVSNPVGSATTGFKPGPAFGALVGHNLYTHLSGELRYVFQMSDLKLSSGGTNVAFSGVAHAIHYDLVWHTARRGSKMQAFVAGGGGVKVYRGTGTEAAYQPLNTFAYLTKTQEWRPLMTAGGGIKYTLNRNTLLRVEFRDYITPFPRQVITPAPGAKVSGWLHDFVPLVGISFIF